ncbi:uncharacterized protein LOC144447178 [Glandiceps talaboti]
MTCPSPELTIDTEMSSTESPDGSRKKRSTHTASEQCNFLSTDPISGEEISLHVGFVLDGVSKWLPENIFRYLSQEFTEIDVYEDPVVYNFSNAEYGSGDTGDVHVYVHNPRKTNYLVLKGERLDCGAEKEDYIIQIGTDFCRVISLYPTELTCQPPQTKPPVRRKYQKAHENPHVLVQVGSLGDNSHFIGYLRYIEKNESVEPWMIVLVVALILLIIILVIVLIICLYRRWKRSQKIKRTVIESVEIDHIYQSIVVGDTWKHDPMSYLDKNLRKDIQRVMIDRRKLKLHEKEILGEGFKGKVVMGVLKQYTGRHNSSREVAVKMLKGDMKLEDFRTFMMEGLIMKDFDHQHVLPLLGVCLQRGGIPLIVLPYMKNGDLKSFITNPQKDFVLKDLLTYGLHIAEGMAYLSEMKFVHRDLAARNCMVDEMEIVKISDFGLSRDLHEKDYYSSMDKSIKLPVKWMAPESFRRRVFTTKTDVWAFGILLWELITRGEIPYGTVDSWDLLRYLSTGKRLNQPQYATDDLYGIMLQCWNNDPDERPDFKTLAVELRQLLRLPTPSQTNHQTTRSYLELDNDQFSSHFYQNLNWHGK